jgi:hypothetical protein
MNENIKPKVYVFQTDNRGMSPDYPFEFIPMSIQGNKRVCEVMGWNYVFHEMNPDFYHENHPAVGKIYMVHQWLQEKYSALREKGVTDFEEPTFLVFLDTDAWIRDASRLRQLLHDMGGSGLYGGKRGAFSRDPYIRKNTFVNSGSFILRVDASIMKMYEELVENLVSERRFLREWPWDQVYVSEYVWQHREDFLIFKPDVLNTGYGKILRHNWHKTSRKIRDDLYYLCHFPVEVRDDAEGVVSSELDDGVYPNVEEKGYDYMDFQ